MSDTPAPSRPTKPGQILERDGQRYVIDKVLPDGVIKLRTEGGAFAMFSHINKWPRPKAP